MKTIYRSFVYAFNGIVTCFTTEVNFRIHLVAMVIVIAFGLYFNINKYDWMIITICIGAVLMAEMLNSAVENLCDYCTTEKRPAIKAIKDISAGAVLVVSIASLICAFFIFSPLILG
jgi:diacylglycerol kinase